MEEKTLSMVFKNTAGAKATISVRDVKELVLDADVTALMNLIITNNLIKSNGVFLAEKVSAQVVTKSVNEIIL